MDEKKIESNVGAETVPSLFIPKSIVRPSFISNIKKNSNSPYVYKINDKTFPHDLNVATADNSETEFKEFEIYATKCNNANTSKCNVLAPDEASNGFFWGSPHSDADSGKFDTENCKKQNAENLEEDIESDYDSSVYFWAPRKSDEKTARRKKTEYFHIDIMDFTHGVLVNKELYLPSDNWHTIVPIDENLRECIVCDELIETDKKDVAHHINHKHHKTNLRKYKALALFDISITRKIGQYLHCGVCNRLFPRDEQFHHVSEDHEINVVAAVTRASELLNRDEKKTRKKNRHLLKDLEHLQLDDDSYHMIITPKPNRFYCMVCIKDGHVNGKQAHCDSEEHMHKLTQCHIIESGHNIFIRRVCDKYYHCGECNNLQSVEKLEYHIKRNHPNLVKKCDKDKFKKPTDDAVEPPRAAPVAVPAETVEAAAAEASPVNREGPTASIELLYKVKKYNIFGQLIKISVINYNAIIRMTSEDFFCVLCTAHCKNVDILRHINSVRHGHLLQVTPFLDFFNHHLIRWINNIYHCGICNATIMFDMLRIHVSSPPHTIYVRNATSERVRRIGYRAPKAPAANQRNEIVNM